MHLNEEVDLTLQQFIRESAFANSGDVITDLDGTAVHEYQGRIVIPEEVELGLLRHYKSGRPIVLNSLRFPLSVLRTFGQDWYKLGHVKQSTAPKQGKL